MALTTCINVTMWCHCTSEG